MTRRPFFDAAWYIVNAALGFSVLLCLFSMGWEYSTRKYLKGFSDAIIPASASPMEKVQTILTWMAKGPGRRAEDDPYALAGRDPEQTLNYQALLHVCGSATNAFVNLANASGLAARRLLLLNNAGLTANHVVAEVHIGDRWIVVDPSFDVIPRGPDGSLLTREDLEQPNTFNYVFQKVPKYDLSYKYTHTAHLRLARVPVVGRALRWLLDHLVPGWEDSVFVTLLAERLSFTATTIAIICVFFFLFLRLTLRHYAEAQFGVHYGRLRERLWKAFQSFLQEPS